MAELQQAIQAYSDRVIELAAEEIMAEIRASWSEMPPSLPGTPPARISGELDRSVHVEGNRIIIDAPHAAALEFGGPHLAPRPFVRPAVQRVAERIGQVGQEASEGS